MLSPSGPAIRHAPLGHRTMAMFRSWLSGRPAERGEGFAVLRWWPNGVHDLFGFAVSEDGAQKHLDRDERSWEGMMHAPSGFAVVPASWVQVQEHDQYGCTRTDCAGAGRIARVGEQHR